MSKDLPPEEGTFSAAVLPGYQVQPSESGVQYSHQKLNNAAKELTPFVQKDGRCTIASFPCQTEEDSFAYRCKCSFQVIQNDATREFQYAMRHKGKPVPIGASTFPIANRRIQIAMEGLMDRILNNHTQKSSYISRHLASVTFAASWNDHFDENNPLNSSSDCIITLNYDTAVEQEEEWIQTSRQICTDLKLTQLYGRSRKILLSVIWTETTPTTSSMGSVLRDTVWLIPGSSWNVSLQKHPGRCIPVHYQKPEGAFFHPNARVMCQALQWMLDRISIIVQQSASPSRLLEMYCGCGAHTIALAKSGLLSSIHAVELDPRLVDACNVNIRLNDLNASTSDSDPSATTTPTSVVRGDAGDWAKEQQRRDASGSKNHVSYDILLLDPPRQGLDDKVINMAIHGDCFRHILIISCGHDALVRDLKILCDYFEIVDCTQLDLFPRTDSVETLVHLQRRKD